MGEIQKRVKATLKGREVIHIVSKTPDPLGSGPGRSISTRAGMQR